jgi:AcrR family transcriptional regulator
MDGNGNDAPVRLTRRERKKNATHEAIVRAALDLFMTQGYSATTVAQIADRADVSESTFFNHFPAKEELVLHGIDSKAEALVEMLRERDDARLTVDILAEYLGEMDDKLDEIRTYRWMMHRAINVEPNLLELQIGRWSAAARPALLDAFGRDLGEGPTGLRTSIVTGIAIGLANHLAYVWYAEDGDDEHVARCVALVVETITRAFEEVCQESWLGSFPAHSD